MSGRDQCMAYSDVVITNTTRKVCSIGPGCMGIPKTLKSDFRILTF